VGFFEGERGRRAVVVVVVVVVEWKRSS